MQVRNQNLAQEEDSDGYLEGNDGAVEPPRFDSEASSEQVCHACPTFQSFVLNCCTSQACFCSINKIAMRTMIKTMMKMALRQGLGESQLCYPVQLLIALVYATGSFFNDRTRRIDYATARHLLDQNNAQQELIQRLLSENQQLQEMKRQKVTSIAERTTRQSSYILISLRIFFAQDQAIQRLLGDIKELRSEGAVGEAMHASGESDVNQVQLLLVHSRFLKVCVLTFGVSPLQLRREVTVLKRHRQM
jgi:hypothetical protein